jgi:hypothetical protein
MIRIVCGLLVMFLSAGCVSFDHAPTPRGDQAVDAPRPLGALPNVVTPDQVTSDNARQMAQALWDELDRDQLVVPLATPSTPRD